MTKYFLLFAALAACASAQNADKIRLTDGREIPGDVQKVEGRQLVVRRSLDFGQSVERFPLDTIAVVTFASSRDVEAALVSGDSPERTAKLEALWERTRPFLAIPGSPAGRVGLALAKALSAGSSAGDRQRALELLAGIERDDWLADRRSDAFSERLLVLLAQGRGAEAREAAEEALRQPAAANPRLRAGASLSLALILRDELQALEKENPRWQLDPVIRPERNRLYHRIIELLLIPYLENGIAREPAARSLWELVSFHRMTGNADEALSVAKDIAQIYPAAPEALSAKSFIQSTDKKP